MENTKITRMCVFDFDGTLVDTPLPDSGKLIWKEKTGDAWKHIGWWGKPESLCLEVFDIPLVPMVHSAYKEACLRTDTLMVMITGRIEKLSDYVIDVLDLHDLSFDEYHYNNGGETCASKLKTLDGILERYPDITEIVQFDDRLAHIPRFEEWGDSKLEYGRLKDYTIVVVPTTHFGE